MHERKRRHLGERELREAEEDSRQNIYPSKKNKKIEPDWLTGILVIRNHGQSQLATLEQRLTRAAS